MGSFWLQQLQPRGGRLDGNGSPSGTLVSPRVPSAPGAAGPQSLAAGRGGFGASAVVAAEPVLGQS